MRKVNMLWTKIAAIALGAVMAAGIGATLSSISPASEVEAASTNTKRVWMKNSITSTWDADGAGTAIHYWGGTSGTAWPGVRCNWDAANSLVYYDIPDDVTTYMFVRVSGSDPISDWGAKTGDLVYTNSVGNYFNLTGPIAWGGATTPGSFVSFTPSTTTIVQALAATIDTDDEACSRPAAQAAVNTYNSLSTFEQNQFNALIIADGKNGSQLLNYLIDFYGITTLLNANYIGSPNDRNIGLIIAVSVLGLTSLTGLYFVSRKRKAVHF
ncbi:MAG: hypothetical protein WC344_03665 [Bacilli bacterium]|jgi:hypothetical protein